MQQEEIDKLLEKIKLCEDIIVNQNAAINQQQHPYARIVKDLCKELNVKSDSPEFIEILKSSKEICLAEFELMRDNPVQAYEEQKGSGVGSVAALALLTSLFFTFRNKGDDCQQFDKRKPPMKEKKADKILTKAIKYGLPLIEALKAKFSIVKETAKEEIAQEYNAIVDEVISDEKI